MKIDYDQETDAMTITLRDASIDESDEVATGVIADFGEDGQIARFEILGASSLGCVCKGLVGLSDESATSTRMDR